MDDYYAALGVEPGSDTADIRTAYREKKAALDAKGDKTEIARVNKAWNVLSDPYQRGRYDEQRSVALEAGDLEAAPVGAAAAADPPRRRRLFEPAPRGEAPPPPKPTIELPAGMQFADQKRRLLAMVIDLTVILALFIGSQVLIFQIVNSRFETEVDRIEEIQDELNGVDDEDGLNDQLDDAEDRADDEDLSTEERDAARAEEEELQDRVDELEEEQQDLEREIVPTQQLIVGAFFFVGLLYLVVPSAINGQTLGKRIQHIRVVNVDGSPLGWKGALFRYGLLVLATYALSFLLTQFAAVITLIAVLGWMRNPNKQGMHDRLVKTVVVDA